MNFNAPLLRPVRMLLFPFSLLYALIVWIRNKLFDKNILSTSKFNLPVIGIGNLSAGGTGKSPMVEFILRKFGHTTKLAVLSRGYKRKTSGYTLANEKSTALEIGDEPMLFHSKFPHVAVAVGEERIVALPQLLHDRPDTEAVVLDDAFQHRYITPGLDILLTEFNNLFFNDWFLPTGDLRDLPSSYKRAHVIVVTKCHPEMSDTDRIRVIEELKPLPHQEVFFTTISYGEPYHLISGEKRLPDTSTEVLLVSGIANPKPLKKYIAANSSTYNEILYNDHHVFSIDDWKDIRKRFEEMTAEKKIILTTEKDAVRLVKFGASLIDYPLYVIPIEVSFLFEGELPFTQLITKFIASYRTKINLDARKETI